MSSINELITILVIDDEEAIRESCTDCLEDRNYNILTAENGKIGVELFKKEKVDLVLTDLRMPEMDGLEVLRQISDLSPETPLIVISGTGVIGDAIEALHKGAWDYLLKPINDFNILIHAVTNALEKARLRKKNKEYQENLERMVENRTEELKKANDQLVIELNEREQIEKELRESEEKHKTLFESSLDAILLLDSDRKFIDANSAALKLFQIPSKEMLENLTPEDLSPEFQPDGNNISDFIQDVFKNVITGESRLLEWTHKRLDGSLFPSTLSINSIVIGKKRLILETVRDITKQKRNEEQIAQSRKMDAIGQLAGGIAHDFNNILSAIIGSADLLMESENELGKNNLDYINIILQAAINATDLTTKLLAFGRKGTINVITGDINTIIDDTISILKRTIDKKISIVVNNGARNTKLNCDVTGIQNALLNIGINASHAMPDGGELKIESKNIRLDEMYCKASPFDLKPKEYIQIEIVDTGCGIPLESVQHIFEPFYTTKEKGKGTGLGLAAVYGTVQDHSGAVNVYSEVDVGTSFQILLPCVEETTDSEEVEKNILSGQGLILLVDDENFVQIIGKQLLEKMGYKVLIAGNGVEALKIFKEKRDKIDLVILDMIMPKMNGYETFYKIKEIEPNCRIIMSSGFIKDNNLKELQNDGLLGFIRKPFRNYELSQLLDSVLKENKKVEV